MRDTHGELNSPIVPNIPADDVAAEIADLIHGVGRRIRAIANEGLEPLAVTPAQARALRTLANAGRPMRMSDLAERLRIARRSATTVVDELAARGLVERLADTDDRRAVLVAVTAAGRHIVAELADRRHDAARKLSAGLSRADLVALRALLRKLDS